MMRFSLVIVICLAAGANAATDPKKDLDRYILEAESAAAPTATASPGSLFSSSGPYANLGLDLRASKVNDLVTILVQERASALSKGSVKSARTSSASGGVKALGGRIGAANPLANLAELGSESSLDGEAATTRETVLSTTITARIAHVLANGNLIVEGTKTVTINAETQAIVLRGIVRPVDISTGNTLLSDRIAAMEVRVNGKGVVQDAIRRPFFLYRLLLGLLPF
jgi:flagellar L-ring protein precursor FlgH